MRKSSYKINVQSQSLSDICLIDDYFKKIKCSSAKKVRLPTKLKRFVVLKSPHVNKKTKEHFQLKMYKRLYYLSGSFFSVKEIIQKIPKGVSLKVTNLGFSSENSAAW